MFADMALWEDWTFYYNSDTARTTNPPESKKDLSIYFRKLHRFKLSVFLI